MSDDTVIWHNPRCSKSRKTLQLLEAKGIEPRVIKYLDTPPSAAELHEVLEKLDMEPRDLMRKKEQIYRDLNLAERDLSRDELVEVMVEHPKLIERPVVLHDGKVALGRPPENVLDIV